MENKEKEYDDVGFLMDDSLHGFMTDSRAISASTFDVTEDRVISFSRTSQISPVEVTEEFSRFAHDFYPPLAEQKEETKTFLLKGAATVVDAELQKKFIRNFSHQGMLELYERGVNEVSLEYEMRTAGETHYALTQLILLKDFSNQDLLAVFITRDISNLKQYKHIVGHLTNDLCDFVALLDLKEGKIKFKSVSSQMRLLQPVWKINVRMDYTKIKEKMARSIVEMDGSESFMEATSTEALKQKLLENPNYVVIYNMKLNEEEICRKQIMYMWLDSDKQRVLAMQTDVSETYRQEKQNEDRINRELHLRLGTDPVTGLPTKNSTQIQIMDYLDESKPFVVMIFTLTNLMEINGILGRNQGNMLLYGFAHIIKEIFDDSGFIGRYMGSEILYVSQKATKESLQRSLDALDQRVKDFNIENEALPIVYVSAQAWSSDHGISDFDVIYSICSETLGQQIHQATGLEYNGGNISQRLHQMNKENDELKYKADHDGLTGMYNKTAGLELIRQELTSIPRGYHVMFVIDIDNFKTINDHFGHDEGDKVLVGFAKIIQKQFRKSDILVRYGGDEFIVLITDVGSPAFIETMANQIIYKAGIFFKKGGYVVEEAKNPGVSIGVVWSDQPADTEKMFKRADKALYKVKNSGKNKFEIVSLNTL